MKKNSIILILVFFINLGSLSAQTFKKISLPKDSYGKQILQNDTLKILAVMVEFAEDKDASTFGNGKFGTIFSKEYGQNILDPLPHDRNYFLSHLEFTKNYFRKVSNNRLNISYSILQNTVTVSQTMRNYSPAPNSEDFTNIGQFSKEAWTIASTQNPDVDFSQYDLFLILHAGVGRDISLPGSIGNERDLPSVYLSDKALRNLLPDITGLPVNRNGRINSMIIPETESRELENFGSAVLFEVTINGILVANIASHLGLPDLFNTETGISAIGKFGLMDGQSIFAYNGIFPPEPSAWEKVYLGWVNPVTSNLDSGLVNITTQMSSNGNDTTIFKIPINSSEYYLVENRQRDANRNGSMLRYVMGNDTLTKTFLKDTTGYYSYDTDSVDGVVLDVDEYDWATPGNGIVFWHIDENIINAKIAENKINVDINNRGVDVEEADGIQDIGEEFTTIFGDVVIGEGEPVDFWFKSNKSRLYKNSFTPLTRPNTNSNNDANSLIYIKDISDLSNKMSFKIKFNNEANLNIAVRAKLQLNQKPLDILPVNYEEEDLFLVRVNNDVLGININGVIQKNKNNFSEFRPALVELNSKLYIIGVFNNTVNIWDYSQDAVYSHTLSSKISTSPVTKTDNNLTVFIGTERGELISAIFDPNTTNITSNVRTQFEPNSVIKQIIINNDFIAAYAIFESEYYYVDIQGSTIKLNNNVNDILLTRDKAGKYVTILSSESGDIFVISEGQIIDSYNIGQNASISSISAGDVKKDGENYLVFSNGINLEVRNFTGASAENFPVVDPDNKEFLGTPLIADFNNDNRNEVISITKDGRIFAFDAISGKILNGFPLTTGSTVSASPVFYNSTANEPKASLAVLNDSSALYVWNVSQNAGKPLWFSENGDYSNTSFAVLASTENMITTFFPENRVYNWPNPIYNGEDTFIRYFVSEDSKINIKIFDLAGEFVAELNDNARGGFDQEIKWNTSDIQSGVYLARVEASGTSGANGYKIIKIAVIK